MSEKTFLYGNLDKAQRFPINNVKENDVIEYDEKGNLVHNTTNPDFEHTDYYAVIPLIEGARDRIEDRGGVRFISVGKLASGKMNPAMVEHLNNLDKRRYNVIKFHSCETKPAKK